ncbi:hypothetical protein ACFUJR_05855 [Streptomyces sp. NPDC057271]|uniref:hypothetical protein n=1 Tax=unclassified Streptomyces TaxID=2593676 RepID=UPI003630F4AC
MLGSADEPRERGGVLLPPALDGLTEQAVEFTGPADDAPQLGRLDAQGVGQQQGLPIFGRR